AADYEYTLDRFEIYRSENGIDFDLVQRIVNTPSLTHYEVVDVVKLPGIYTYRIIAFYQNDCESDYAEIEVEVIGDDNVGETLTANVAMYPNPTFGLVTIKAEAMSQLTVVNVMGQVLMTQAIDNDEVVLDMSSFENGMYLVNIITDNGNVVKVLNVLR
ncbi:MAG: T9SS type A sorting domain-containing protein, partial [Bacteroidales bacterium]|nr:T9SS type A sorting domain-containing protein [Bacteroidales bacterium]